MQTVIKKHENKNLIIVKIEIIHFLASIELKINLHCIANEYLNFLFWATIKKLCSLY